MAIVNSLAVGKATKTAGELTYAKVRGRTIARRRIISNKSNTAAQGAQRFTFGVVSSMAALIDPYIKQNFAPTEYGSARNCFMKRNWPFLKDGYQTDNPAEMTIQTVLHDIINAGGYIQYGVGVNGTLSAALNESDKPTFNIEIVDNGYNTVTAALLTAFSGALTLYDTIAQPRLNNGVWTLTYSVTQAPNVGNLYLMLVFVDGVPVTNNSCFYYHSEEGGL